MLSLGCYTMLVEGTGRHMLGMLRADRSVLNQNTTSFREALYGFRSVPYTQRSYLFNQALTLTVS